MFIAWIIVLLFIFNFFAIAYANDKFSRFEVLKILQRIRKATTKAELIKKNYFEYLNDMKKTNEKMKKSEEKLADLIKYLRNFLLHQWLL